MGLHARLLEGEKALEQFRALLVRSSLPNLFSLCGRAMQVDGNLGATAAIAEMLVQSHADVIHLLPALPAEWREGSVRGLRARGGYEVDVAWAGGVLTRAQLRATRTGMCVVQANGNVRVTSRGRRVRVERRSAGSIAFEATSGEPYDVVVMK